MDSRLTMRILWLLLGFICMRCSQAQGEANLTNVSCTCVPYHMCKNNSTQVTTGDTTANQYYNERDSATITINISNTPKEGECSHYLDTCCFPVFTVSRTPPPIIPTGNPTPPPVIPKSKPTTNPQQSCGIRNPGGVGFRITGDKTNEANYGEFPWMVAVLRLDSVVDDVALKVMECGGSIIHPQFVLTAAHCVKGKQDLSIRAGEWDTQSDKEAFPTQDRNVKEVIIQSGYYKGGLYNDIALLVLDEPLEMNRVVGTLCLPEQDENMDGRNCVVTGWGKDNFGKKGRYQTILRRVEQPMVMREVCQYALRKTRLGPTFWLHDSFVCAGGVVGLDSCKGDGGGPLACPSKTNNQEYVQAGVVSWGIGCGTDTPAVYAKVAHIRNWIDSKIASLTTA